MKNKKKFYYVIDSDLDIIGAHKIQKRHMKREFSRVCKKKGYEFYSFSLNKECLFNGENLFIRRINKVAVFLKEFRFFLFNVWDNKKFFYIRGELAIFALVPFLFLKKIKFAFELHNYEFKKDLESFLLKFAMKRAKFLVTISEYTAKEWVRNGIDGNKIEVLHSGVSVARFDNEKRAKLKLRSDLNLPNVKLVGYIGSLYENRGVEDIIFVASKLKKLNFVFVGGNCTEITFFQNYIRKNFGVLNNIYFIGNKNFEVIHSYIKSMDLLLAPYLPGKITSRHMSPIKLFEYMASGVPALVSDLESVKNIVTDKEVNFFKAGEKNDLENKIKTVFKNYDESLIKAVRAYKLSKKFDWNKRAEKIIKLSFN